MKRILFIAGACALLASPARADLFGFNFDALRTSYTGTTFTSNQQSTNLGTTGSVTRFVPTEGRASFDWSYSTIPAAVNVTMTIGNINNSVSPHSATATGVFTLTDMDGDTITGNITGTWYDMAMANHFTGSLSNVRWQQTGDSDNLFNGQGFTSISMDYSPSNPPWSGTIIQMSYEGGKWFGDPSSAFTDARASLIANVVPIPSAALMGLLGLGVAGLRLRKFV